MEISEPERAAARFQAVVASLLAPGRGAQLFVHSALEVRLQVGADAQRGVVVLAQVLLAHGDDAAGLQVRLQPMLDGLLQSRSGASDQRFSLRIIVVTTPAEADAVDATLRTVCEGAPAPPALQAFRISSDGTFYSPTKLLASEVGPALREQAKRPLTLLSDADFAARCEAAIAQAQARHSQLQDFAQGMQARRSPVTYALLGLNLLMFALSYLWGDGVATGWRMGAVAAQPVLAGQWWRLLAATALHAGSKHLLVNSLTLWMLGRFLEPLLGSARFLTLYVLSGLCGSLLGVALGSLFPYGSSVGASGATCGLLAACGALGLWPRGELPESVAHDMKRMALANMVALDVQSLLPHVDWRAHLGGALAGAALIFCGLVRPTVHKENRSAKRQIFDRACAALWAGLLLLSIATALGKGQPWVLTQPQLRQRIALAGTPLSLEVPRMLGAGTPGTEGEGTKTWIFNDPLASPLTLVVITIPFASADERERYIATKWGADREAAQASKPPFAARELTISGLPTLALSRTFASGVQDEDLLQARQGYKVFLQLRTPAGVPQRMIPKLAELLETIQDEPR